MPDIAGWNVYLVSPQRLAVTEDSRARIRAVALCRIGSRAMTAYAFSDGSEAS
jgi:hypothetical protein